MSRNTSITFTDGVTGTFGLNNGITVTPGNGVTIGPGYGNVGNTAIGYGAMAGLTTGNNNDNATVFGHVVNPSAPNNITVVGRDVEPYDNPRNTVAIGSNFAFSESDALIIKSGKAKKIIIGDMLVIEGEKIFMNGKEMPQVSEQKCTLCGNTFDCLGESSDICKDCINETITFMAAQRSFNRNGVIKRRLSF